MNFLVKNDSPPLHFIGRRRHIICSINIHIPEFLANQFYSNPLHCIIASDGHLLCHIRRRTNVEGGTEIRNRNRKLTFSICHCRISIVTKSLNSHTGNRKFRSVIYYNASKLHHSILIDLLSTLRSFANLHLVITRCIIIHFLSVDVGAKGHGYSREKEPLPHSSYYVYSILHIPLVFFCRILFIILKIFRL